MKIVGLIAENFKRLKLVDIKPTGNTVVVSGANEQGKTSLLDSIWWVMGGADMTKGTGTKQPIRRGEKKATVKLDLGDLIATRTATESGDRLTVENKDGDLKRSPQAVLDALVSKVAFDPLSFANMDEHKQKSTLLNLVDIGVDLDELAVQRGEAYNKRTLENRTALALSGQLAGLVGFNDETPDKETSSADVVEDMNKAIAYNDKIAAQQKRADDHGVEANAFDDKAANIMEKIEFLKTQIAGLDAEGLAISKSAEASRKLQIEDLDKLKKVEHKNIAVYREKLSKLEVTNRVVRAKQQHTQVFTQIKDAESRSDALSKEIDTIDKTKSDALAVAKFPVDALSFSETGVTYKDIPFSQCSSAERLRVSIAIAMAANPTLKVIRITDGSLIDKKNMAIIEELAGKEDYQVWIEKVDESGKVGIYIEDGEVREPIEDCPKEDCPKEDCPICGTPLVDNHCPQPARH